jgi:hypothetical protein
MAFKLVLSTGLLLVTVGCVTVQKVQPAQFIPAHNPSVVWVTTNDNAFTPVGTPRIEGDSLKGVWSGLQDSVAFSLSQIQYVQAKLPAPKRTVMLATVLTVVVGGSIYSIATAGNSGAVRLTPECGTTKGTVNNYC